jgi:hypothetical protein
MRMTLLQLLRTHRSVRLVYQTAQQALLLLLLTAATRTTACNCLPLLGTQLLMQSLRRAQAGTRSAREETLLAHAEVQLLQ